MSEIHANRRIGKTQATEGHIMGMVTGNKWHHPLRAQNLWQLDIDGNENYVLKKSVLRWHKDSDFEEGRGKFEVSFEW